MVFDIGITKGIYSRIFDRLDTIISLKREAGYVDFTPKEINCQHTMAQTDLLQFIQAGKKKVVC